MNKLEEYRDKVEKKHRENFEKDYFQEEPLHQFHKGASFEEGFDAAIALDLPIKFAEWFETKEPSWKDWRREHYLLGGSELRQRAYQYWIENIFKPE